MSVALFDSRLFSGAEQAEKFGKEQKKFFLTARKRNKRYMKIPVATEKVCIGLIKKKGIQKNLSNEIQII